MLLFRSRFFAPATHSPRFYREYFKPAREREVEKDRRRWLVAYPRRAVLRAPRSPDAARTPSGLLPRGEVADLVAARRAGQGRDHRRAAGTARRPPGRGDRRAATSSSSQVAGGPVAQSPVAGFPARFRLTSTGGVLCGIHGVSGCWRRPRAWRRRPAARRSPIRTRNRSRCRCSARRVRRRCIRPRLSSRTRRDDSDRRRDHASLHAVTHPCPEDLAVLLVHNGTDKYLLMSNAGGCRPLQGTTMRFNLARRRRFRTRSRPRRRTTTSQTFRAVELRPRARRSPRPRRRAVHARPAAGDDQHQRHVEPLRVRHDAGNRGVIAGGWSLEYDASPHGRRARRRTSRCPAAAARPGRGARLSDHVRSDDRPDDVAVDRAVVCDLVTVAHVSRQPADRAAIAGGHGGRADGECRRRHRPRAPGRCYVRPTSRVADPCPTAAPSRRARYRPGGAVRTNVALPAAGAAAAVSPRPSTAFDGEPARGIWKLWVYDDADAEHGRGARARRCTITTARTDVVQITPALAAASRST